MDEEVGLSHHEQLGDCGEALGQAVDDATQLGPRRGLVGLLEDRADDGRDHAPGTARDEVLGVPGEMDPAALPGGAKELLVDRLDQSSVVVADDQPDAGEAALDEPPDEARPGRALVVACGELEPEHAALAGRRHAGRHERRHRGHPPCLADLDVRGVEPQVRVCLVGQRAAAERLDLGVEGGADRADLALRHRGDPERVDEVLDPARADPEHVCLADHGQERPLGPPPRLEERWEVRAVADPRDRQLERADPGVPAAVAIPVPAGQPPLRVAFALGQAGQLADLRLHDRLDEHLHPLAQEVDVALGDRLAHRLEHGHPVLGHCGVPPCRRFSQFQRREDDAVAASVLGLPAVTPSLGTQPANGAVVIRT